VIGVNKRDCEQIGQILSASHAPEHICDSFFQLDSRIQAEYDGYAEVVGRQDAVDERFHELMNERFGAHWSLRKIKPDSTPILEQARREIYGEDYHPSLFR
jgi:hypothetical protein